MKKQYIRKITIANFPLYKIMQPMILWVFCVSALKTSNLTELITFPEQDVKATCNEFISNSEDGNLAALNATNSKPEVMQHLLSMISVKNEKTNLELVTQEVIPLKQWYQN
jgi:hypothetical protein